MLRESLSVDGEFFHIRNCAHILKLIVHDGLKEVNICVSKIRESIKYVRCSQGRKKKLLEFISQVSLECKKGLHRDVPTRWNSTILMLESALYYQRAFRHLQFSDSNYKEPLFQSKWVKVEKNL